MWELGHTRIYYSLLKCLSTIHRGPLWSKVTVFNSGSVDGTDKKKYVGVKMGEDGGDLLGSGRFVWGLEGRESTETGVPQLYRVEDSVVTQRIVVCETNTSPGKGEDGVGRLRK